MPNFPNFSEIFQVQPRGGRALSPEHISVFPTGLAGDRGSIAAGGRFKLSLFKIFWTETVRKKRVDRPDKTFGRRVVEHNHWQLEGFTFDSVAAGTSKLTNDLSADTTGRGA